MKRRDFLKSSVPLASIPLYVGGMPVSVLAEMVAQFARLVFDVCAS